MTTMKFENHDVIRIHAMKCDGLLQPEFKRLCVDPKLTSLEILYRLLAKAFDIKDFTVSYEARLHDSTVFLALHSDWDIEAAFLSSANPCLRLKIELNSFKNTNLIYQKNGVKPFEDIAGPDSSCTVSPYTSPSTPSMQSSTLVSNDASIKSSLFDGKLSSLGNHVSMAVSHVGNVITRTAGVVTSMNADTSGLDLTTPTLLRDSTPSHGDPAPANNATSDPSNDLDDSSLPPIGDQDFRGFMDPVGHLIHPKAFRLSVYKRGVAKGLRRVVWRHLLNVYPKDMNGRDRYQFLRKQVSLYEMLRDKWQKAIEKDSNPKLKSLSAMIQRDVNRTDSSETSLPNKTAHLASLYNILMTYALTHSSVSYRQGMSDIASPLLIAQWSNEAEAYICFVALMQRRKSAFLHTEHMSQSSMIYQQMLHFDLVLKWTGDRLHHLLASHNKLFVYRWLLLEMKREFTFEDAMNFSDVLWSSLPPEDDVEAQNLGDLDYSVEPLDSPDQHASTITSSTITPSSITSSSITPSTITSTSTITSSSSITPSTITSSTISPTTTSATCTPISPSTTATTTTTTTTSCHLEHQHNRTSSTTTTTTTSDLCPDDVDFTDLDLDPTTVCRCMSGECICEITIPGVEFPAKAQHPQSPQKLPPPVDLGAGNPFLICSCVALLLLQGHSLTTSCQPHDYHELAMMLDSKKGQIPARTVLAKAREIYAEYVHAQAAEESEITRLGT